MLERTLIVELRDREDILEAAVPWGTAEIVMRSPVLNNEFLEMFGFDRLDEENLETYEDCIAETYEDLVRG